MSEPVTNVDIEDVLSSIRRLVSNSNDGQGDHASSDESTSDKLVLTPSLRIDDPASEATDAGAAAEEIAPAADVGLQASAVADDPEPHDSDDTPTGDGSAVEETGAQGPVTHDGEEEAESAAETRVFKQQDNACDTPGDDATTPLGAQAAEFEAAVAGRDDQWEPDGLSEDDYAGGAVTALDWQDADELSSDPDLDSADEQASDAYAQAWDTDEPKEERTSENAFCLDDAVIDEDTLRDMVAEIVRQELQGTLGERITRNVRKLVRREIHRALTSQDFD
jgi:cell pole-organizing protein PopZ